MKNAKRLAVVQANRAQRQPASVFSDRQRIRSRILQKVSAVHILDVELAREFVRSRQEREQDLFDEVWEGVYVVPPLARNSHQDLVSALTSILFHVVNLEKRGRVLAGANVSDRQAGWERNYRDPDIVVVLNNSRAVDCETHWMGGPDFLVEVQSPNDETEEKILFYSQLQVRELLIVQRDARRLRLLRHDGFRLVEISPSAWQGKKWFLGEVVPLAFRRCGSRHRPQTEVQRTDGIPGRWIV